MQPLTSIILLLTVCLAQAIAQDATKIQSNDAAAAIEWYDIESRQLSEAYEQKVADLDKAYADKLKVMRQKLKSALAEVLKQIAANDLDDAVRVRDFSSSLDTLPLSPPSQSKENARLTAENEKFRKENQILREELALLKKDAKRPGKIGKQEADPADDPFAVGTVFTGTRFYNRKGADKEGQPLMLEIVERDERKFNGKISFEAIDGNQVSYVVKGLAPTKAPGAIEFESEKKGLFKQYFSGQIDKAGEVSMIFRGTGVPGFYVEGRAVLRKK